MYVCVFVCVLKQKHKFKKFSHWSLDKDVIRDLEESTEPWELKWDQVNNAAQSCLNRVEEPDYELHELQILAAEAPRDTQMLYELVP